MNLQYDYDTLAKRRIDNILKKKKSIPITSTIWPYLIVPTIPLSLLFAGYMKHLNRVKKIAKSSFDLEDIGKFNQKVLLGDVNPFYKDPGNIQTQYNLFAKFNKMPISSRIYLDHVEIIQNAIRPRIPNMKYVTNG